MFILDSFLEKELLEQLNISLTALASVCNVAVS